MSFLCLGEGHKDCLIFIPSRKTFEKHKNGDNGLVPEHSEYQTTCRFPPTLTRIIDICDMPLTSMATISGLLCCVVLCCAGGAFLQFLTKSLDKRAKNRNYIEVCRHKWLPDEMFFRALCRSMPT
jgi:hypothetical protein